MADKRIDQLVAATTVGDDDLLVLQQNNQAKKLSGKKLGDYVYAAAAGKVAEVEQAVAEAQAAVDSLEEQKDTIAEAVASMAQLGTDTTLTTAGMAADAEATGNKIKNLESDYLAQMEQGTGTPGSIVTFTDGAENAPLKKLVVDVEPQQDLHGYDYPWPAGGGKNLLQVTATTNTINGITFTVYTDGRVTINGTATAEAVLTINQDIGLGPGSYVGSGIIGGSGTTYVMQVRTDGLFRNLLENTPFTIETSATQVLIDVKNGTSINNVTIYPMICESSAQDPTSFEPYENICPITGWTGVNVARTGGKNLLDPVQMFGGMTDRYIVNSDGSVTVLLSDGRNWAGITQKGFLKAGTYILSRQGTAGTCDIRFGFENYAVSHGIPSSRTNGNPIVLAVDTEYIVKLDYGAPDYPITDMLMLEEGSSATAVEPYIGHTYSIAFPSEAGTVYGGTLENNGDDKWKLTVDRELIDLSDLSYTKSSGNIGFFHATLPNTAAKNSVKALCSQYKSTSLSTTSPDKSFSVANGYYGTNKVAIHDEAYINASASDFKAAMSGVQLVYELATPIEYTLTSDQVRTLLNLNNVWADTGDIEELIYYKYTNASRITEDVQSAIEPMIAGVEETMTATTNYAVGDILMPKATSRNTLELSKTGTVSTVQVVVTKVYTMPDGQQAVKVQRIK